MAQLADSLLVGKPMQEVKKLKQIWIVLEKEEIEKEIQVERA